MIVDLSVVVDATTKGPPAAGSPPVRFETAFKGPGHWQSSRMAALIHTGSHVDAPVHVVGGGRSIEDLGLDEVVGSAVVLDVHEVGEREAIDVERLRAARDRLEHATRPAAVVVDFFEEECAVTPEFTSEDFVVHRAILGADIPIIEQATGLGGVGERFEFHAPFVSLAGVEAAPCRIFGVV
jgi:arylformamidase